MIFKFDKSRVARIKDNFQFGVNKEHTGINVVILAPLKFRGEKNPREGEYYCKVFTAKVISDIKLALERGGSLDLDGVLVYSRYEPKDVINKLTGEQHSQPQWDFIINKSVYYPPISTDSAASEEITLDQIFE